MIVIDTSALIALLLDEPDAARVAARIGDSAGVILPASVVVEAGLVYGGRHGPDGLVRLDRLVGDLGLIATPFTPAHAAAAREGFLRFGKGRHRAGLNFGDCMSYGVAKAEGWPLLFTGGRFAMTDVGVA